MAERYQMSAMGTLALLDRLGQLQSLLPSVWAEGEGDRAVIVGWIVFGAAATFALVLAAAAAVSTHERLFDRLERAIPKFSFRWFVLLGIGLILIAAGFIFDTL